MTKREACLVSGYTGVLIVKFDTFHKFVEKLLGRPVWTHEFPNLAKEIKEKCKNELFKKCKKFF